MTEYTRFRVPPGAFTWTFAEYTRGIEWLDIFTFTDEDTQIECPNCEQLSPGLRDVYSAMVWVTMHLDECVGSPDANPETDDAADSPERGSQGSTGTDGAPGGRAAQQG